MHPTRACIVRLARELREAKIPHNIESIAGVVKEARRRESGVGERFKGIEAGDWGAKAVIFRNERKVEVREMRGDAHMRTRGGGDACQNAEAQLG